MMLSTDIGIDLGTANTLIYERKKGIILNEPSVIAIDKTTQKAIDVGTNAYKILGKEPKNIKIIYPLKKGTIEDADALELMINAFIKKIQINSTFIKPRVLISLSSELTTLEKNIIKEILLKLGARKVYFESSIKAAAIGTGMNVSKPIANMIVDIGGTTTDIGVLSLSDIVKYNSIKVGGTTFDNDIVKYIREKYKILIGEKTAESLKINYLNLYKDDNNKIEIKGKNLITGLPDTTYIEKRELKQAVKENINKIVKEIIHTLEQIPPELSADIVEKGIVITGGCSKIGGLIELINKKTNVPIFIAEFPLMSVIEGSGILLNELKLLNEDQ